MKMNRRGDMRKIIFYTMLMALFVACTGDVRAQSGSQTVHFR